MDLFNMGLTPGRKTKKMIVYTAESSSRFGVIKHLVTFFNDCSIGDVRTEMQKDLNMWINRYNRNGDDLAKRKIEKIKKEIESLREIDENELQKEEDALILTEPVEISAQDYNEMLEILQPLQFGKNSFIMSEFFKGVYTAQFFKKDGKYYHAMIDYRRKETWRA